MRASHTTRSAFAAVAVAVALASLGSVRGAAASPQSGTAPGVGVWIQPGRGAQLVRNGGLAIALVRARDTGNRLEWSGRSPTPITATRQAAARSAGAPRPKQPTLPFSAPDSATNGSADSRSRLIDSRGNDHHQRKRLPDAWALLDPPSHHSSLSAGSDSAPGIRLTAGEAVFHDAHAPPARDQSLDSRLS